MTDKEQQKGVKTYGQRGDEGYRPHCPFCNTPLRTKRVAGIVWSRKAYDLFYCDICAAGITVPFPSQKDLSNLYSGGYRTTSGKRFNAFIEWFIYLFRSRRKRLIEKQRKRGRILDIGCGRGVFLSLMKKNGWDVAGTEFNEETASYAASAYGIRVMTGDASDWEFADTSFDVITINHVLEHINEPVATVRACRRLLRKGGLLVVAVPNLDSLQAAAGHNVWFHLDIPGHLYHFTEKGLIHLLKENAFHISKVRRFDLEYGPFGWLQTLLNRSGIRENFLYDILKKSELRQDVLRKSRGRDVVLTTLLAPLYLPLSFVLSLFESFIMRKGGTIEVYAVKE
jgi:2-polyprenyl-3-methyl-5-hydroxy-6-metoxy-1,4-benzoquinol methylase